jgi:DNA-binding CsgD family transcriptional regulator
MIRMTAECSTGKRSQTAFAKQIHETGRYALMCPDWAPATFLLKMPQLQLLYGNAAAWQRLAKADQVRVAGGQFLLKDDTLDRRFRRAAEDMLITGRQSGFLVYRGSDANEDCSFSMRYFETLGSAGTRALLVELRCRKDNVSANWLQSFAEGFSLSKAEAELLLSLIGRQPLEDMARERQIAVSTLRQRMKSILQKTRCRKQAELVGLVHELNAGMFHDSRCVAASFR